MGGYVTGPPNVAGAVGVLPIANGGSNSSTALGGGGKAIVSNATAIIEHASTTATEIGYVAGVTSAIQTQINAKLTSPTWATFTPTVTLVGGAGNIVPVYTTNAGRYITIGKVVFAEVELIGDGGAEGAGTGQVNIALPVAASANQLPLQVPCGTAFNAADYLITGSIAASATTISLGYFSAINALGAFTGADQNNVARQLRVRFSYEID